MGKNMGTSKLVLMVVTSLLGTISFLLMMLDFPLPYLPAYLKIDFSDVPALIAAFIFTPLAGVIVELIKNILHLIAGGGEPVGVSANFFAGSMFILPIALLYRKYKSSKSILSGIGIGTVLMALSMSVLNYFVLLPIYGKFLGWEQFLFPSFKWFTVYAGILPFNIVKGVAVGIVFLAIFKKMRQWIERKRTDLA